MQKCNLFYTQYKNLMFISRASDNNVDMIIIDRNYSHALLKNKELVGRQYEVIILGIIDVITCWHCTRLMYNF